MSLIAKLKAERYGFVSDSELDEVVKESRLQKVLIRCGNGRLLCAAQDAKHFVEIINASGKDYVRDVSLK
jgi:UDP-N-acetylglucosamine transferase subunit ALG13